MRVLVTGSSGLIGRWVCQRLKMAGHEVVGFDLRPATSPVCLETCIGGDILDGVGLLTAMKRAKPQAVIHLAARVDLDEQKNLSGYAANIEGVRNVIAAIREVGSVQRAVYTSSQLVCRVGHVPHSMDEYCPNTLYGQSKVLTEKIVKEENGGGCCWCLARPTTVWGPGMSPHYQSMLRLIRRGRFFHCGKSPLRKSYAYAENIAWQYVQLLAVSAERIARRTYYLADYEPLSLRDYLNALAEDMKAPPIPTLNVGLVRFMAALGDLLNRCGWRRFPFNSFRLTNILTEYILDLGPTEAVCGPLPVGWREGVRQTADWFLKLNNAPGSGERSC